jgi:hypothetical protein
MSTPTIQARSRKTPSCTFCGKTPKYHLALRCAGQHFGRCFGSMSLNFCEAHGLHAQDLQRMVFMCNDTEQKTYATVTKYATVSVLSSES